MAGNKRTLKFLLALQTAEFKKGINSVKKQLKGLGGYIKGAFAAGSITLFGRELINASKDFEDAMARVKAVSNATTKDFNAMVIEAKKLGSTTIYSAEQAASALENLTRNGMTAKQATQSLSGVLQLAQANAIELSEAADIVTNTLNMFGLKVMDVNRVNDVLSTTASHSATNVSLLYEAMVNAAPIAHTLGFSLEETSAALGALANRGVKGANAGTQLRMALVKMVDPNITKKLNAAGVAIDEQSMKIDGLVGTLKKLKEANLSNEELVGIFSQKGAVGIQQLTSAYDNFLSMLGHTENAAGTAARMFEQGVGSVRKELDLLKNQFNAMLIDIGESTSGFVKDVTRWLQNIVAAGKTTTSRLTVLVANGLALLSGKIVKAIKEIKVLCETVKAEGAAAAATMGGWITAIATLITMIGTSLYGAWVKNKGAIRDANKEFEQTSANVGKMKSDVQSLIDKLGPDTKDDTLAGVVNELSKMFPDFATEINNAAKKVKKDGGWEDFKKVLQDIVDLQTQAMIMSANRGIQEANTNSLGSFLQKGSGANNSELKRQLRLTGKDKDTVYKYIAQTIVGTDGRDSQVKAVSDFLNGIGVGVSQKIIETVVDRARLTDEWVNATKARISADAEASNIRATQGTLGNLGNNGNNGGGGSGDELKGDKKKINDAIDDYINTKAGLKEMLDKHAISEKEYKKELDKLEDSTLEAIVTTGKYKEILKELARTDFNIDDLFTKVAVNSGNELMKDFLKQGDKTKQKENLGKYAVGVPEARDTSLDYSKTQAEIIGEEYKIAGKYADDLQDKIAGLEEAIKNGDFDDVLGEAIELLGDLNYALSQTLEETNDLGHATVLAESIEKIDKQIEDLKGNMSNTITDIAKSFERCYNAITDMFEAFGGEMTEEAKESWERFFSVINGGVQIFETLKEVCEAVKIVNDLLSKKRTVDASKQILENAAITESEKLKAEAETAAAVAGAASSSAGIPGVGVALAIAGISAIIAALASSKNKFANGGIVGGNSYSGDNVLARVNSGELILNKKQQATLYNAIKSGNLGGGGKVEFEIKGQTLKGVLNNYEKIKRG